MNITAIRIDDRLIHGQIVTKWIKYANASAILVIDDKTRNDPMLKMIISLAVPNGIELIVATKDEAKQLLMEDDSTKNTLVIMRNPKEMLSLIEKGVDLKNYDVIVGNMSFDNTKENVKHVLDYIFVNDDDINDLRRLESLVKSLTIKAVPEENGKSLKNLF